MSIKPSQNGMQPIEPNFGIQSQNLISPAHGRRQKVPFILQQALRQNILLTPHLYKSKSDSVSSKLAIKPSKLGHILRNKMNNLRNILKCEICEFEIKKISKQIFICECQHRYNFCQSCLHHYVIYKVNMFEEVLCPHEGCNLLIDINGIFFRQLPLEIQKNYRKLHNFYQTVNNPNNKLCQKQNCEGIISIGPDGIIICNLCESVFCQKCSLIKHEGQCEKHEVEFFQNNLHFRQCKKCKFIIQKNQGCNHMTCRCGYQFCYVCSAVWNVEHYGNHDQKGNLISAANAPHYNCCDCQQICGQPCACILKFPFKIVLFILFLMLMLIILVLRDLLIIIGLIIVSIIAGIFGFSFEYLFSLSGEWFLFGFIFFPVCIIAGIGLSFKQIFFDIMPGVCRQYRQMLCDGLSAIFQI